MYYECLCVRVIFFEGYAAGPHFNVGGSGSNFLCLPEDPQWKTYINGGQRWVGAIYGVEYELPNAGRIRNNVFSEKVNKGYPLHDSPAPCAVCYVAGRSTTLMIPARTQCPQGWIPEYSGYLVSQASQKRGRSNYVCWDEAPETAVGGKHSQNHAVIYPVEVRCGSLPCSEYISGRELACIVCSK